MSNIYEKILAIMQDIQYLTKDDHVKFGSTDYKALSEEKVTSIMREQLIKKGLIIFPIAQESNRVGNITHVDTKYRMVNVENPDEFIEIVSCGDGADTQDKGSGKAMTYAFKYMWLRVFALPTGEDPDKISSAELDDKAAKALQSKQPPTLAPPEHKKMTREQALLDLKELLVHKFGGDYAEMLFAITGYKDIESIPNAQLGIAIKKVKSADAKP